MDAIKQSVLIVGEDHKVICAQIGVQGLEIARSQPPDVILLNKKISDLDCYDVRYRLYADPVTFHEPVLMIGNPEEL